MSKIEIKDAFAKGKAFIGFVTGGDPNLEKSEEYILKMAEAGCDLIEIGIPFSDPIAEGPVIQAANIRALQGGATTDKIFEMTRRIREKIDIPMVFLTYLNPIYRYGYEHFCQECKACGVNGLIIPDMPFEERQELEDIAKKYGVAIISLIAPTSKERIHKIAAQANGFVYVVSSLGVTGTRAEIKSDLSEIIAAVKEETELPVAVGFGINTQAQVTEIAKIADGVIVGSAIVKIIETYGEDAATPIYNFIKKMKDGINR